MENKETLESFTEYCKNYIVDHIWNYEGQEHYACDFGDILTEGPNADGSVTCSRKKAMDYLHEWWDEAGAYWEYEKFSIGEHLHNPFDNPEAYMVCMLIDGCRSLLSQCKVIDESWNDYITLDKETIESILSDIEDIDNIEF